MKSTTSRSHLVSGHGGREGGHSESASEARQALRRLPRGDGWPGKDHAGQERRK